LQHLTLYRHGQYIKTERESIREEDTIQNI